jgi:regulator of replication initiation timing
MKNAYTEKIEEQAAEITLLKTRLWLMVAENERLAKQNSHLHETLQTLMVAKGSA